MEGPKEPPGSRPLVIVVDADAAMRNSLMFLLEVEGFRVQCLTGGAELLRAEELHSCSCAIIDQRLPGTPGIKLIAKLRAGGSTMPAVLLSGSLDAVLRDEAADAGVRVVEKPIVADTLLHAVRSAISPFGEG